MSSLQTTPTRHVEAGNGVRFAYRTLGPSAGIPLLMHTFFRSNMDFWDPVLINTLATVRPVILFDQAGVGRSSGTVATTYQGWANNVIALTQALDLEKIDLLGFSMGGAAVQMVALTAPNLVRKLILAGTTASSPSPTSDVSGIVWPRDTRPPLPISVLRESGNDAEAVKHAMAVSFFYETDHGRAACCAYWNRLHERKVSGEPPLLEFIATEGSARQTEAMKHWSEPNPLNSFDRLGELEMPVLVINGDNDVLIPTSRSWELAKKIPSAQLIIYPKAGHGFLYQEAELVAAHVNMFLDHEQPKP